MLAEDCVVQHSHDVVFVVFILLFEKSEKTQLDSGLVLEALFVANHFYGHRLLRFVIETLEGLAKTSRPKFINDFESIGQVVFYNDLVVASIIVKAKVVS